MSKVPCGGFELDESLALKDGKLGLAPGAGGSQADWNVTDSADPAFIKNKPFGAVKGKEVGTWNYDYYKRPTQNEQGKYVYTFTSNTEDWNLSPIELDGYSMAEADIIIDGVTYENVRARVVTYSGGTDYNFITDGLPFSLSIESLDGSSPDTLTFTYDKSEFVSLTIIDKNRAWNKTLDIRYLDTTELSRKFIPVPSNALDKQHLNYDYGSSKIIPTYDTYLKSSTGKIFKLVVDDSGNLSATQA